MLLWLVLFCASPFAFHQTAQGFGKGSFGGSTIKGSLSGLGGIGAVPGVTLPPGVGGITLPPGTTIPGMSGPIGSLIQDTPMPSFKGCTLCEQTVRATEEVEWYQTNGLVGTVPYLNKHTDEEFKKHQTHIITEFWEDNILPAMMMMADQLSSVAMQQVQIFGSFMDAQNQLETQRLFQTMQAQAHKDYHPSTGMCEFGSTIKSLAASERKSDVTAVILSQRSLDRQLGNTATAARAGPSSDMESRIKQFKTTYCNVHDNNNGLSTLCGAGAPPEGRARINKDIDYARTVDFPWTLDVDLTDDGAEASDDETDIFALASNLFAHEVLYRPGGNTLRDTPGREITDLQNYYMDARSLVAKRSVAENSFNAITAMKSQGTGGSREFLAGVMEELGITDPQETMKLLGENPSYYAQMEILTKKLYQNPDFYTNLYDKPANVERKGVALQALALMQKFDMLKSQLRSEAALSVLLEMTVMDLQDKAVEELGAQTGETTPATSIGGSGGAP